MIAPPSRSYRSRLAQRLVLASACGVFLLSASGCATPYQIGNRSLYPQDVHTVYVPIFESDSFRRNLGERLTLTACIVRIDTAFCGADRCVAWRRCGVTLPGSR